MCWAKGVLQPQALSSATVSWPRAEERGLVKALARDCTPQRNPGCVIQSVGRGGGWASWGLLSPRGDLSLGPAPQAGFVIGAYV